ncbi:Vms1/Ankzf1 family peptidyl-tRNA hydrolase [Streptomyces sp. NPDC049577]|uniref:baeRF2 domain-containing protein n=1 Tax=Streptomyces sp. NPDC049577 TaxID=3155153 RepID=UPI00343229A0
MTTVPRTDTGTLRDLLDAPGPFLSVYFDRDPRPERGEEAGARWNALARRLADEGAERATLNALSARVLDSLPGTGVLAAFASDGDVRHVAETPGARTGDRAETAPLPHLLPLLEWRQDRPAHVVAVVDRTGADLRLYQEGAVEPVHRSVDGPDDEIVKPAMGGMSQMRFQHRAEDSWEHNAAAAADAVAAGLSEVSARLLLLAGDVRARQYLEKHLPQWVRRDVTVGQVGGGRGEDRPAPERETQRLTEAARFGREQTTTLLRRLEDERGIRGHAVDGVRWTLGALAESRMGTLIVVNDPQDDRTAWFGPNGTEVGELREDFQPGTGPVVRARLADVAVRSALLTGADVRVLPPGIAGAPAQGIGGICRF